MYLTFERNIQVPGSFVVLQGIPGDGLSNTLDVAPDFGGLDHHEFHPSQSQSSFLHQTQNRPRPVSASERPWNTRTPHPTPSTTRTSPTRTSSSPVLRPLASTFHQTFLGQGIPSLFSTSRPSTFPMSAVPFSSSGAMTAPTQAATPRPSNKNRHETNTNNGAAATAAVVVENEESYVLVDDDANAANEDSSILPPASVGANNSSSNTSTIHPFLNRAIASWEEERAQFHQTAAAEWLESTILQQRHVPAASAGGSNNKHSKSGASSCSTDHTIPILAQVVYAAITTTRIPSPTTGAATTMNRRSNDRWWLNPKNAQLRVFATLPCPKPCADADEQASSDGRSSTTLPPGTTVVGIALHSFDLLAGVVSQPQRNRTTTSTTNRQTASPRSNQDNAIKWKYLGQCTHFNGEEWIPPEHCPQPGRIQYLHIESPFQGYILFNVDGYSVLSPGLPSSSLFTGLLHSDSDEDDEEIDHGDSERSGQHHHEACWWWKVTYHDGAVVRQGLDLNTKRLCTLPFGTHVQVLRKVVNAVGLSRLLVCAHVVGQARVEGWCSQFLNPMAGQRGSILQPVPLAVPVWYQIRQSCTVRKDVELSSAVVRTLEIVGATIPVLARKFTEFPAANCLPRLQLAPHAFASLRINAPPAMAGTAGTRTRNDNYYSSVNHGIILDPTGDIDGTFDPAAPGLYHWQNHLKWTRPQVGSSSSSAMFSAARIEVSSTPSASRSGAERASATAPAVSTGPSSTAEISSVGDSLSSSKSSSSSATSTSNNQLEQNQPRTCVCCEDKLANATLIHGQTGHICCCLECARIIQAQHLGCPICRLDIDNVILHFYS
ncbi:hypothetical protein ACA910_009846 [Epithemia clementina (nom. ined.)]